MSQIARKSKPQLWAAIREKWKKGSKGGPAGKWNARKAMLATKEYQSRGGGYVGPRHPANSLKKWEKEEWGYVDGDPKGRYLPKKVREALTPAEKRAEKALKQGKKGKNISYSPSVNAKMKAAGVYSKRPAPGGRSAKGTKREKSAKKSAKKPAKKPAKKSAKKPAKKSAKGR